MNEILGHCDGTHSKLCCIVLLWIQAGIAVVAMVASIDLETEWGQLILQKLLEALIYFMSSFLGNICKNPTYLSIGILEVIQLCLSSGYGYAFKHNLE